tara:strand:+ start:356 stop:466 length:111 start_codon:yes stop_codon:yes gene_type:complete
VNNINILISILIVVAIYGFVVWLLRKWNNENIKKTK